MSRKAFPNYKILRKELWNNQNGKCIVCMESVDINLPAKLPGSPEIDHVIPLSKGGAHSKENWAVAHRKCNGTLKNDKPLFLARKLAKESQKYPLMWR